MKLPKELTIITPVSKFLAIILFVILPFLTFLYGMKYQEFLDFTKNPDSLSVSAKKVKRLPTPTPDPMKDWQTYNDRNNGFILKFPNDYFKFQQDNTFGFFVATSIPQGGNSPKFLGPNDVWLNASIYPESSTKSLDQLLTSRSEYISGQKVSVTIDGINGYKIIYTDLVGPAEPLKPQYTIEGLVEKNNKIYSLSMTSWNKKVLDNHQRLFDTILSTFKFTDNSSTQNISQEDAINLVKQQKEVKDWLTLFNGPGGTSPKTYGTAHFAFDHMDNNLYIIHAYEDMPDHTSSFNWYKVNKKTGEVTKEFNF